MADAVSPEERRYYLVLGLIGDEHRATYTQSATFHAVVEQLAGLLPVWIAGLAALADEEDRNLEATRLAMEQALQGTSVPLPDLPLSDLLFERERR